MRKLRDLQDRLTGRPAEPQEATLLASLMLIRQRRYLSDFLGLILLSDESLEMQSFLTATDLKKRVVMQAIETNLCTQLAEPPVSYEAGKFENVMMAALAEAANADQKMSGPHLCTALFLETEAFFHVAVKEAGGSQESLRKALLEMGT